MSNNEPCLRRLDALDEELVDADHFARFSLHVDIQRAA